MSRVYGYCLQFVHICSTVCIKNRSDNKTSSLRPFRTCPHRVNVRIFRHNFVGGKAKIRRRAVALQGFLTKSPAKFDEKACMNPYVDRFSYNYLIFAPTGIESSANITLHPPPGISAAQIMPLLSTPRSFTGLRFAMSCIFFPMRSSGA